MKLIDIARVAKVRAGGRRFKFRVVVVAGNRQGRVGVGIGKGMDVAQAIEKATRKAQKQAILVPLWRGTIPHEVQAKFGAARILLKPQREGRGVIAGGPMRIICEFAGIKNISGKFLSRTHNKLNNAMVAMKALRKLRAKASKTESTEKQVETSSENSAIA